MEPEGVREVSGWLLAGVPEIDEVLEHPVVLTRDACGNGWHVLDLDPTVTTLRHRALPADDDLPEARRRSEETGAPGHSGRKRGDIVHRRVTVQHDTIDEQWPRDPVVCKLLAALDWDALLASRPQWQMDLAVGELVCAEQRRLALTSVRPAEHAGGRTGIIFRRPAGGCEGCASRTGCLRSPRPKTPKHTEFSVPTSTASALRQRFELLRQRPPSSTAIEPIEGKAGPYAVADSLFLPARARQLFRSGFFGGSIRIEVDLPESGKQPHLVAIDVADRQRRRKTWEHYAQLGIMRR